MSNRAVKKFPITFTALIDAISINQSQSIIRSEKMRFTDIRDSIVSIMKQNLENQQSGKATDASVLNPFVVGEPGIGKTCCVHDAKKILGDDWGIFPYRLADCEPSILGGQRIPNKEGDRVITCEPDWHHEIWKLKAQGFDKGIFFLDEAPEADPMVINVARQLVLGLGVGTTGGGGGGY
jgi:hypothetical protein